MHPEFIIHRDEQFVLGHLAQSYGEFDWTPKGGATSKYRVRVRYSNHCYSRKLEDEEAVLDDDVVVDPEPVRVFCRERYGLTPTLTSMMSQLFAKPTTTVFLTYEANWTVYQFFAKTPGVQVPYRAFFRLRPADPVGDNEGIVPLDMFVESAYLRENQVASKREAMFGAVADMTAKGELYFSNGWGRP